MVDFIGDNPASGVMWESTLLQYIFPGHLPKLLTTDAKLMLVFSSFFHPDFFLVSLVNFTVDWAQIKWYSSHKKATVGTLQFLWIKWTWFLKRFSCKISKALLIKSSRLSHCWAEIGNISTGLNALESSLTVRSGSEEIPQKCLNRNLNSWAILK